MHSKHVLICCYVFRSSPPEVFLGESVLKICSKITGEHPCQSMISIKLLWVRPTLKVYLLEGTKNLFFVWIYFFLFWFILSFYYRFISGQTSNIFLNALKARFDLLLCIQKQPSRDVLRRKCSGNMQQIYRRTPMSKYDFNKVALQLYWNSTVT